MLGLSPDQPPAAAGKKLRDRSELAERASTVTRYLDRRPQPEPQTALPEAV